MENKKTIFKFFTIFQYRQEEEFLGMMHERGWRLTWITFPGFYHFEKCEPRKVTYRLDYNQEGLKNKMQYVQMFSDCGWGYLFYFAKRSVYFVSEQSDGFTIEAEQLNKSVVMEYNLRKGDVIAVDSRRFEGGELFISVGIENQEPVFYGNSYGSMGDFTVEIQEDGCYRIECSGRGAKGVISFVIR